MSVYTLRTLYHWWVVGRPRSCSSCNQMSVINKWYGIGESDSVENKSLNIKSKQRMMAYVSHCTSTMDGNNAQVIWCKTPDSQSSMKRGNTRITSFQHTISTSKHCIYLDPESKEWSAQRNSIHLNTLRVGLLPSTFRHGMQNQSFISS